MQACSKCKPAWVRRIFTICIPIGIHEIVGKLVNHCIEQNCTLIKLPLESFQQFLQLFDETIYQALDPNTNVEKRTVKGGTAKQAVLNQLAWASEKLVKSQAWLTEKLNML